MKLNFLKTAICLTVLTTSYNSYAETSAKSLDPLVQQTISQWMKVNHISGAAVQVYNHGTAHSYYFGYANSHEKIAVTENTVFEIGSLTKLFTTLLVSKDILSHDIALTDPASKYLPKLSHNDSFKKITIENLATYTAGLPFGLPKNHSEKLQQYLSHWKPSTTNDWAYSNISIGLLGNALENKYWKNINDLYQAEIFSPLQMKSSGITLSSLDTENLAQGYDAKGHAVAASVIGPCPAAGAAKASGKDMLQFLKAAVGAPGTPNDIKYAMRFAQTPFVSTPHADQGLSWVIYPFKKYNKEQLLNPDREMSVGPIRAEQHSDPQFVDNALIDKTGATNGFRAYIAVIPKQQSGIVILANRYVPNGEIEKPGREILLAL